MRSSDSGDSVSLPSSPAGARKIGLSYLTPPQSRKMGTDRTSSLTKEHATAPVTITCHLAWPEEESGKPSVTAITRAASPGPFTSVLKSGSLGEDAVTKVRSHVLAS